jgi:hypothetical protein
MREKERESYSAADGTRQVVILQHSGDDPSPVSACVRGRVHIQIKVHVEVHVHQKREKRERERYLVMATVTREVVEAPFQMLQLPQMRLRVTFLRRVSRIGIQRTCKGAA